MNERAITPILRSWSKSAGRYACFTRPELKSERVSYPVMTPSAAKGILEAIYWKPEFDYVDHRDRGAGADQVGEHPP